METDRPLANLHLPESVIHNILSSLPPKDAIRASATSRQWRSAWISSPFLAFDEKPMPFHGADFFDYVDRSLALWRDRCDGRANIERLSISGAIANGDQLDSSSRLAEIVAFAASRHVKAIELLNCASSHPKLSYSAALWKSLCACQSLRELSLECCRLVLSGFSSPIASSLRKLALSFSIIGDSSLQILLSSVPSLEHLDVKFCSGLDELRVALDSLRTMRFFSWEDQAPDIFVEAANLRSFSYSRAFNPVGSVRFSNCRSLTSVEIECVYFGTASAIDECISQIPSLENLTLDECEMRSGVRITHSNLKSLNLQSCFGLLRAEIDTPNLRWFSYCGGIYQFSRFKHCSGLLNVRLAFGARNLGWVWFINLRNFLESFSDCNVLTLTCYLEGFPEELKDEKFHPDPFYEWMNLKIQYRELKIENYASFVGAMVRIFPCLKSLTLNTSRATVIIKFDEYNSFTLDWQAFIDASNSDEHHKINESIDAAMDEIVEFLCVDCGMELDDVSSSWTDEDTASGMEEDTLT